MEENMKQIEKRLYTVKEAAKYYGMSRSSMYKLIKLGIFPEIRIGNRLYLDIFILDDFIDLLVHMPACEDCGAKGTVVSLDDHRKDS